MNNKFRHLKQDERKKILILCDDIRTHSGIATMAKEIVIGTAHHFNWVNLGAAVKHPEEGKIFNLSEDVNKEAGIEDSNVKLIPSTGYGDPTKLRKILQLEQPDAIFIFTDPRYWIWLFDMEREVRSKIPIFYLNIWDNAPVPTYNRDFYNSVDVLMAISKQTKNINEVVLGELAHDKVIEYVPHGINSKHFFPIKKGHRDFEKLEAFKEKVLKGEDKEFILFFNSRNIRRKNIIDTIHAYRIFCDKIGKEKAKKCSFILHTNPVDNNGTDLYKVREAFCDPDYVNIHFSTDKLTTAQLNLLYNISDCTIQLSSNEGWGLSLTESLMTGTPIIANVTGGMQDQMRFEKDGKWIDFSKDFPSNHRATVKDCGDWVLPVFPCSISLTGSVPTPFIYDDKCSAEDAADKILQMYSYNKKEREQRGMEGHNWVTGDESNMSAKNMSKNIIKVLDKGFEKFRPREEFELIKIKELENDYIDHKLINY